MAVESVLKRTISPALFRLRLQTFSVTLPFAALGRRSNQPSRSMSVQARPSTPHFVTSCHWSGGSGSTCGAAATGAAGGGATGVCAWRPAHARSRNGRRTRESFIGEVGNLSRSPGGVQAAGEARAALAQNEGRELEVLDAPGHEGHAEEVVGGDHIHVVAGAEARVGEEGADEMDAAVRLELARAGLREADGEEVVAPAEKEGGLPT